MFKKRRPDRTLNPVIVTILDVTRYGRIGTF
jgi:hypothetical protein